MIKTRYEHIIMESLLPMKILHIDALSATFAAIFPDAPIKTTHFIPPHWHRSLELSLVVKGTLQLRSEGKQETINSGELLLVNSGDIHEINTVPGKAVEVICFLISYEYLMALNPKFETMRFQILKHDIIAELFKKILSQHQSDDPLLYIKVRSNLDLIMYYLFRDAQIKCNIKKVQYSQEASKQVLSYIHDHFHEDIRLESVAKVFYMSREHFTRKFKERFGKTFLDYVMDIRIHHAFDDVVHSNMTVENMSKKYGFPSAKAMIHQFKKRYDLPPITFRNNVKVSVADPVYSEMQKKYSKNINNRP